MRAKGKLCLVVALVSLAACGGKSHELPDGPPGGPDGPPGADSAPPTTATVRVSQESVDVAPGDPIENAKVGVVPPGGGLPTIYMTDATGMATFPVEPSSTVWVARDPVIATVVGGGSAYLYLVEGVHGGDTINLGAPPPGAGSAAGTLTINYTPMTGGSFFYTHDTYFSPCSDFGNDTGGQIVFTTYDGCDASTRELVISAYDQTSGMTTGYLHVPNVAATPGTIDATAATWETGAAYDNTFSGLPAEVTYAQVSYYSAATWHHPSVSGPLTAGAGTLSYTDATTPGNAVIVTQLNTADINITPNYIAEPVAAVPATHTIDGTAYLPFISAATYDDPSRTINWTETAAPSSAQMVTAAFSYYDSVSMTQYRWTIYAPGSSTSLVLPDVPDVITTHDIQPGDVVYPDIWLLDITGSSYSDLLTDVDLYRDNPATSGYRPTTLNLLSGGYAGGKL